MLIFVTKKRYFNFFIKRKKERMNREMLITQVKLYINFNTKELYSFCQIIDRYEVF